VKVHVESVVNLLRSHVFPSRTGSLPGLSQLWCVPYSMMRKRRTDIRRRTVSLQLRADVGPGRRGLSGLGDKLIKAH
jgi:hypothetical protein